MENYTINILNELSENAKKINSQELHSFLDQVKNAKHIFIAGTGRSGLVIKAFANRLMHLGFSVSVIGEIGSPHSQMGDLLIICSGSGETGSLKSLAEKANRSGVRIALVTTNKASTLVKIADAAVVLPGLMKNDTRGSSDNFSQPMGAAFEQLAFLVFDGLVINLMEDMKETSETMFNRHADFE